MNRPNLSLKQIKNSVGDAARLGRKQVALMAVQLADHEKLVPPMGRQIRKLAPTGNRDIDCVKIPMQVVKRMGY